MIARPGFGKRRFGDRSSGKQFLDWREELDRFLITGGTTGRSQSDISRRLINHATADLIRGELEARLAEEKVQKFTVPPKGRGNSTIVWRATTKLIEGE